MEFEGGVELFFFLLRTDFEFLVLLFGDVGVLDIEQVVFF